MRFQRLELDAQAQQAQQMQPQQARQEEQAALDRDERHWMRQADVCRRAGQYEEALRYYSRALEAERTLVACWVGQVQMLVMLGEHPEAELWSRKALELFRNNADLLAGRAQALCRLGQRQDAMQSCDAAIGQPGLGAYPWMVRGELMLAKRDHVEEYCFDKAAQLDPDWLVLLEIGAIYLYYRQPYKALQRIRHAVEKAPDQAHCWFEQARCEEEAGLGGAARRSFARCLEIAPNHAEAAERLRGLNNGSPWRRLLRRLRRCSLA